MPGSDVARMAGRVYRLNSLFDPRFRNDASAEGQSSVFGLSVMSGMYDAYRVYFTTIEARWFKRDDEAVGYSSAEDPRAWAQGQVMHLEVGTTADTTTDNREWVTDSIQRKSRVDGTTGDAVEGLYEPPAAVMPLQIRSLLEGGATFPGGVKFKALGNHYGGATSTVATQSYAIPAVDVRTKKQLFPRIAASVRMRHLSREPSDAEFRANAEWGATMDADPLVQRLVGVGWGNSGYILNTDGTQRPVVPGYMQVKMKFYSILSAKEATEGFTVDPHPA